MSAIDSPLLKEVRGKGLLNAIVIEPYKGREAWDLCEQMAENGFACQAYT